MKYFNLECVLLGLVVPLCGVVGGVALLSGSRAIVLSSPVVYLWVFVWFVLTPVCLGGSWYLFGSKDDDEDGMARGERGTGREEAR